MIVSHKYRFIFIKTVKTAGTSIEVFLSGLLGRDDIVTPIYPEETDHFPRNYKGVFNPVPEIMCNLRSLRTTPVEFLLREKFYNHIPAYKVRERIGPDIWNSYFKFCVERNPWDKTVSHFSMLEKRSDDEMTFDHYLEQGRYPFNYPKYCDPRDNSVLVDRILYYENLNRELTSTFEYLGIPFSGNLDIYLKSEYRQNSDYRTFFTAQQATLIEEAFQFEIQLHGYQFK